jgi:uncharacterized damage-inducible protein DinB
MHIMNEAEQLERLFTYDRWANKKIIACIADQPFDNSKKCIHLLAHISAAQQVWYRRIKGRDTSDITLWPQGLSVEKSEDILQSMHGNWKQLISENSNRLDDVISYQNSKGNEFNTRLADIIHHVIIHGQHHRAQMASLLSDSGITPPGTDYILYLRETDNQ